MCPHVHPSHRRCVIKLSVAAEICLRAGCPVRATGDVMAQKVVKLGKMVSIHAIAVEIISGAGGRRRDDWRQGTVGFLVNCTIAELHEPAAKRARFSPTAAVFNVLRMALGREDQLTVFTDAWTTTALVSLQS